jgi:nitroimidazol reductase NimA-like FMN-containing flavoprotein (pyridoxamine 5'-phosphate oxidase superfamily)
MGSCDWDLRVKRLLSEQRVGVLCTSDGNQPFGSPMAFAVAEDLSWLGFASDRNSEKARILERNPLAAFVVDNRPVGDLQAESLEVAVLKGVAKTVKGEEARRTREELMKRHPDFANFFQFVTTEFYRLTPSDIRFDTRLTGNESEGS